MAVFGVNAQNIMEYETYCALIYPALFASGWFVLTKMGIEIESLFYSICIAVAVICVFKVLDLYLSFRAKRPLTLEALSIAVVMNCLITSVSFGLAGLFGLIPIAPDGWDWGRCVSYMTLTAALSFGRVLMFLVTMIATVIYHAMDSLIGLATQQRPPPNEN